MASGSGSGSGDPQEPIRALISIEKARAYLQVDEHDGPSDEFLSMVLLGLTGEIERWTKRTFLKEDPDEPTERIFRYTPGRRWVWIDDCRELESVELSTDVSTWTEASDWFAAPLGKEVADRICFTGEVPPSLIGVRVTAKWGYAEVPDEVALACAMWLQNVYKRDAAYFSDDLARPTTDQRMPTDVRQILKDFRRKGRRPTSIKVEGRW